MKRKKRCRLLFKSNQMATIQPFYGSVEKCMQNLVQPHPCPTPPLCNILSASHKTAARLGVALRLVAGCVGRVAGRVAVAGLGRGRGAGWVAGLGGSRGWAAQAAQATQAAEAAQAAQALQAAQAAEGP